MSRESSSSQTLSLDQLIALNDELAALVRAGLPLEQGLVEFGHEIPGKVGEITRRMGIRLQAGESLEQIIDSEEWRFPPVWRAVLKAGMRSGRLSSALESLTTTARRVAETRQGIGVAMIYPLMLLAFGFAEFLFVIMYLSPTLRNAYLDLTSSSLPMLEWLVWLGQTAKWWAVWVPVAVGGAMAIWWYRLGRAARLNDVSSREPLFQWLPSIGNSLRNGRLATFSEVLGLLLEHHVPLHEAVSLAAESSGLARLKQQAKLVAERIRSGHRFDTNDASALQLPPLLGWLIASGQYQGDLPRALARSAERYRQRAERASTFALIYLPIVLTVIIGGSVLLLEGLVVFTPLEHLLFDLGRSF